MRKLLFVAAVASIGAVAVATADEETAVVVIPESSSTDPSLTSAPAPSPVAREYTVQVGDTLWEIAERLCSDPFAYVNIFNRNQGVAQAGGGASTDPNLVTPGWLLLIDCPLIEFQPAPPEEQIIAAPVGPGPSPGQATGDSAVAVPSPNASTAPSAAAPIEPSPGGESQDVDTPPPPPPFQLREVPVASVHVSGVPAAAPSNQPANVLVETSCAAAGASALPQLEEETMVLRAGLTSRPHQVAYGHLLGFVVEDMGGSVNVRLVAPDGSSQPIEHVSGNAFELYIDPKIPSASYVVEATGEGSDPAFGVVSVTPAPTLSLLRQPADGIEFLLAGAGSGVQGHVYQQRTDGCAVAWAYWQPVGAVDVTVDGNARLVVVADGAPVGLYCITIESGADVLGQCTNRRQLFEIG